MRAEVLGSSVEEGVSCISKNGSLIVAELNVILALIEDVIRRCKTRSVVYGIQICRVVFRLANPSASKVCNSKSVFSGASGCKYLSAVFNVCLDLAFKLSADLHTFGKDKKLICGEINVLIDKIKEIIVEQLNVDESLVTPGTHLMKDLEADSLDAVNLYSFLTALYSLARKQIMLVSSFVK